jgi:hypothetical protein
VGTKEAERGETYREGERETEREEGGKKIVGLDATYRHTGVSIDYSVGTKEAERGEWYWEGRKLPTTI